MILVVESFAVAKNQPLKVSQANRRPRGPTVNIRVLDRNLVVSEIQRSTDRKSRILSSHHWREHIRPDFATWLVLKDYEAMNEFVRYA